MHWGERQQLQIAFNGPQLHFLMLKKTHMSEEIPVAFLINLKSGHQNELASDGSVSSPEVIIIIIVYYCRYYMTNGRDS